MTTPRPATVQLFEWESTGTLYNPRLSTTQEDSTRQAVIERLRVVEYSLRTSIPLRSAMEVVSVEVVSRMQTDLIQRLTERVAA